MVHVLLAGASNDLIEIAEVLTQHGHHVTLVPRAERSPEAVLSNGHGALLAAPEEARAHEVHLRAINIEQGRAAKVRSPRPSAIAQRYSAGERLSIPVGSVLRVVEGAVVLSSVHEDGAQVMIGILGPDDLVLPHSEDGCHVEAAAQTDVEAELFSWSDLAGDDLLASALALRILRAEAWTAAQAHPRTEERVLSILRLLAEQFGEDHQDGRLLRIRLTQGQLAAITGATRPTISRVMAVLRRKGKVRLFTSGRQQRFLVTGDLIGMDRA